MKKSKKFVLAGLFLLVAITMVLLPLTGCKTEVDPSTPRQEQPDGNTSGEGNNDNTSGENNTDSKPCSHQPGADDGDCTTEVKCRVCGEVAVAAKSHDFSGGWQKDAENHWHNCKNGGCNKTNMIAAHTGGTATCTEKAVCTVCSTAYGTVDANSHIDENTDHKCDRECGKADIGTHADSAEDNDHLCDYGCGATLIRVQSDGVTAKSWDNAIDGGNLKTE